MRAIKTYLALSLLVLLFFSCQNDLKESVVFYSNDKLVETLSVKIQDTEGNTIPVQSTEIGLNKSSFFNENIQYLTELDVTEMSVKVINQNNVSNLSAKTNEVKGFKIFLDEIDITSKIGITSLQAKGDTNLTFRVTDSSLLSTISSKLLQRNKVIVSYKSDVNSNSQLDFQLEFSLAIKGTFVD
ncbi:MAG: hypothetical protein HWD85_13565 [Flavobacteriaceae bacterium]|nr:hypothetical protein [Flavobacteriaceae bacterium]